jgi:O-antigen/teichoic acid export membrane protein
LTITGRLLAKNTLLSLLAQITPLMVAILAIPIVVDRLGLTRLGILSLVWVLLGYAGVLDLGIARALTQRTSQLLARGQKDQIAGLATSAVATNFILGLVGGLSLFLLAGVLPHALGVPQALVPEAAGAFSVMAVGLPVTLAMTAVRGLIEGAQRFDLVTLVAAPASALTYALPAAGALAGFSLPTIVGLLVAGRVGAFAAYILLSERAFPNVSVFSVPHWGDARSLLGYGGWLTISSASAPAIIYGERAIIASVTSAGVLGLYVIPYELAARMWVIPGALAATLFPAFTTLNEIGIDRIKATYRQSLTLLVVALGPLVVILVSMGGPLLRGWLGAETASSITVPLQIFAVGAVVNSLGYMPLAFLQASGRAWLAARLHLTEIPATYLVTWGLVAQLGLVGAAIAWLARVTIDSCVLFILAGRGSEEVAAGARASLSSIAILGLAILCAALSSTIETVQLRAIAVVLILFLSLGFTWRLSLTGSDRALLASLARGRFSPTRQS